MPSFVVVVVVVVVDVVVVVADVVVVVVAVRFLLVWHIMSSWCAGSRLCSSAILFNRARA